MKNKQIVKKRMGGFVPVDYLKAGKVLMVVGLVVLILSIIKQVLAKSDLAFGLMSVGTGMMIVGIYLIKYVPGE